VEKQKNKSDLGETSMKLRWERITGIILIGVFIYLSVKLQPLLQDLFQTANGRFNYDSPIKAIMLGVLCLTLLVGIKLIVRK
jgi:hypothetical protein